MRDEAVLHAVRLSEEDWRRRDEGEADDHLGSHARYSDDVQAVHRGSMTVARRVDLCLTVAKKSIPVGVARLALDEVGCRSPHAFVANSNAACRSAVDLDQQSIRAQLSMRTVPISPVDR